MKSKAILLLLFLLPVFIFGVEVVFLIDASYSMNGFIGNRSLYHLVKELNEPITTIVGSDNITYYLAAAYTKPPPYEIHTLLEKTNLAEFGNPRKFLGTYTLMKELPILYRNRSFNDIVIIITDNVPTTREEIEDTQLFYDALMEVNDIKRLDISPLLQPFDGDPRRTSTVREHQGDLGLMCYYILRNPADNVRQKFLEIIRKIEDTKTVFHIHPITADHIKIASLPKNEKTREPYFEVYTISDDEQTYFRLQTDRKRQTPRFNISRQNSIKFSILVTSTYRHVGLRKGTLVDIQNFNITYDNGRIIPLQDIKTSITPTQLSKNLEYEGAEKFDITITFQTDTPSLWSRIIGLVKSRKLEISFDYVITTENQSLYLIDDVDNKYFTQDLDDYQRIYTPSDLLSMLNHQGNKISINIRNEHNPHKPTTMIYLSTVDHLLFFIVVLVFALFCFLVWFAVMLIKTPLVFTVQVNGEHYTLKRFSSIDRPEYSVSRKIKRCSIRLNSSRWLFTNTRSRTVEMSHNIPIQIINRETNEVMTIQLSSK